MTVRAATGISCLLVYAGPLFFPPEAAPLGTTPGADAGLLHRIFPGVSPTWVLVRLLALGAGALLLSRRLTTADVGRAHLVAGSDGRRSVSASVAICIAAAQACVSPWAGGLGPMGQFVYLSTLFLPALALTAKPLGWPARVTRDAVLTAGVVALWLAARVVTDIGSARVADVGERWQGWLDLLAFVSQRNNLLTDLFDPDVPGVGGVLFFLHGVPWFQLDVLAPTIPIVQLAQLAWVAITAVGVALLARIFVGPGLAPIAAAVFLFSPYTRFVTIFPGPSLAGPLYATSVVLFATLAVRHRSESGLAALGPAIGIAATLPTLLPVVGCVLVAVAWGLRGAWRDVWRGLVGGSLACAAVVVPAFPAVLQPPWWDRPLPWHGSIGAFDATLLGQLPLRMGLPPDAMIPWRSADHVVSALLAPFAHPRISTRLWGDALFDPIGAALLAIGVVACLRSLRTSAPAWLLLTFFIAALAPALFVSPVDVVDAAHAVALPVPVALLAAAGFPALARSWGRSVVAATLAVCFSGTLLFDVVNPRILSASSFGIMHDVLTPDDAERALVLAYGKDAGGPTKMLFTGPTSAFGPRPVGYLEYAGGAFPDDLTAGGKDLLFWSHGYDQDVEVATAVCRRWPQATLYEIWDRALAGRVHGALVSDRPWQPHASADRWQSRPCATPTGG